LYHFSMSGEQSDWTMLLYTVVLKLAGMNPVTMVRVFLPICLFPLFYATYHYFAKGRIWFLIIAYTIFGMFIFVPGYLPLEVFLNVWNPATLTISIFLPLFYVSLVERSYVELAIVVLAMVGLMPQVWVYMVALVIVYIGVQIGYRIYDKKGGTQE